ncbi:MAG TPA: MaoC family dehydratase [Rhizomicrobium sp.]|nr:MaoC family dehydratase [Rhizomicrobium sp.]
MSGWFEDIKIGARQELGSYIFTQDEIIAFARKYDPQVFHIDPEAAKQTMFGGLIASGWHTAAVWMKLAVAGWGAENKAGISPGFEDMRWLKPVRPGMTVSYSTEIIEKVELKSRPELGLIKSLNEGRDENGEVVFRFIGKGFVPRRPKGEPA